MKISDVGTRVAAWAQSLGYSSTSAAPSSCVVANRGGEERLYLRQIGDDFVVSSASRSESERFEMSSRTVTDCEKFLVAELGSSVRRKLLPGSPALALPTKLEQLAPPFSLVPAEDDPRQAILLEGGRYRARFASLNDYRPAVLFTNYADVSVDTLKESFLDTTGDGLFPVNPSRPASGIRSEV